MGDRVGEPIVLVDLALAILPVKFTQLGRLPNVQWLRLSNKNLVLQHGLQRAGGLGAEVEGLVAHLDEPNGADAGGLRHERLL